MRINEAVLASTGRGVLGSIATIRGLSDWSDEQIVDLAYVAHDAMITAYTRARSDFNQLKQKAPFTTTTLVVDNTAYLSSAANGGGAFLYIPNGQSQGNRFTQLNPDHPCDGPVQKSLIDCQATAAYLGTGHRSGAACGEPMAALAFCVTNNQRNLENAKIVTIKGKSGKDIIPPCAHPDGKLDYEGEWGCHSFLSQLEGAVRVIPHGTGRQATDVPDSEIVITYATYP